MVGRHDFVFPFVLLKLVRSTNPARFGRQDSQSVDERRELTGGSHCYGALRVADVVLAVRMKTRQTKKIRSQAARQRYGQDFGQSAMHMTW